MAADKILRTYGDSSAKEDVVLNAIEILTATETQVFNMLGKTKAIATVHNYLVDTLDTAASLAVAEGADFTASALTTPTRLTNIVQLVVKEYKVTRMQQAIEHYHGQNERVRQRQKALRDWGRLTELLPRLPAIVSNTSRKLRENILFCNYQSVKTLWKIQSAAKLSFL